MKRLIKEEKFEKDNIPYVRKYFGTDEDNITGILEAPDNESEKEYVKKPSTNNIALSQIILTQQELIVKQNEHEKVLYDLLSRQ